MRHTITALRLFTLCSILIISGRPAPTSAQDLPPEAYISGITGHAQQYNLSCESRSAVDWAAYWGVWLDETQMVYGLPRTDNPETGFVGDPNGSWGAIPPASYGVHAMPIAEALRGYGLAAEARTGMTWDELRAELAAGKPVIVWIIGQVWAGMPIAYTASDGETVTVAAYEHSMIAIGYGEGSYGPVVHLVDAYTGYTQTHSLATFLASWSVLGNQAVVSSAPAPEPTAQSVLTPGGWYTVQPGDTLSELARQWGVSWPELAALNQMTYPFLLYTGQVLQIPTEAEGTADSLPPTTVEPAAPEPEVEPEETRDEPAQPPEDTSEPAQETVASEPLQHVVEVGDSLVGVAGRYGVTWQTMVELNRLAYPYFLFPGDVLFLPVGANVPLAESTADLPAQAGEENDPSRTYIVQPGEFLTGLAEQLDIEWEMLAEFNGIGYPYVVHPGQVLQLP